MNRRRALVLGGAAMLAAGARAWAVEQGAPLEFGIFPYLSPRALMNAYQPLKLFIEGQLGRPVQLSTAASFEFFNERTLRGDYDLVLTPPHFARLAQTDAKYVPLAAYSKQLRAVIAVRQASRVAEVSQLRGKVLAIPDRLAIVTMLGRHFLAEHGLRADIDYTLQAYSSHISAAYGVVQGDGEAVILGLPVFNKQLPAEVRQGLRILTLVGNLPPAMYLAHPRLGAHSIGVLRSGLLDFANKTPEGRSFIDTNGFEGIRPVTDADMKAMDPYVAELRSLIK